MNVGIAAMGLRQCLFQSLSAAAVRARGTVINSRKSDGEGAPASFLELETRSHTICAAAS